MVSPTPQLASLPCMLETPNHPFRWTDLDTLGIPEFTLRRWLQDGRVRRVLRNVYCPGSMPDDVATRARCAKLTLPDDAVLCDRSAAWLWGVNAFAPDERLELPDLEVAVEPGGNRPRGQGVRGVRRDLVAAEIVTVHGLRVTSPVRTALDLACRRGRWGALAVLDGFMRTCGISGDELTAGLARFGGRRGVTQARDLVPRATGLSESTGESWTRGVIIDAGLPVPTPQFEIAVDGVVRYRLDLAYPQWRIAVEYDGEEFHGVDRRDDDEARRRWLREHGWCVIVVRKDQLSGAAREDWLVALASVINSRSSRDKVLYARRPEPWVQ